MGYYNFLTSISNLESLEFQLDERFDNIVKESNESSDCSEKSSQWIIDYLCYVDDLRRFALSNLVIPKQYVEMWLSSSPAITVKSLNDICSLVDFNSWKKGIVGENYLDEMSSSIVFKAIEMLKSQRLERFYVEKLIQIKFDSFLLKQKLIVKTQIIENKEEKEIFDNLFKYLELQKPLTKNESNIQSQTESSDEINDEDIIVVNHPFQNLEIMNFFLHIEKITSKKSKIFYSYFREFLISKDMFSDANLNRQNYYNWINKEKNLTGKTIVQYQHNLSSENDYFKSFESELKFYEKTIKQIPRIE